MQFREGASDWVDTPFLQATTFEDEDEDEHERRTPNAKREAEFSDTLGAIENQGTFPGAACCLATELPTYKAAPLQGAGICHLSFSGPGSAHSCNVLSIHSAVCENMFWTWALIGSPSRLVPSGKVT